MDHVPSRKVRIALLLGSLGALPMAGCATRHAHYDTPSVPMPGVFKSTAGMPWPVPQGSAGSRLTDPSAAISATGAAGTHAAPTAPTNRTFALSELREWWRLLGDETLNQLVDRALANNPDLHIATARIEQGWTRTAQAHARRLPVVGMSYQAIAQKPNATSVGTINTPNSTYHDLQLSLTLNADPWGERSAAEDSASLQMWRLNYVREDTRRTVVANAVSLYVDYLSLNDRLRIAHDTEDVLNQMLESVHGRMQSGDATMIDYEQQRAAVHAVAATIPVLELQRETSANGLAALLGVPPSALSLPVERGLKSLSFPAVMPSIPTQLLLNRPDVHAAEMRLHAAQADIAVARARLLPTLDLTAQTGYGAQYLSNLVSPTSFYWNAIASVSATLFDHGAREDDVAFAQSVDEELVENYAQTIYGAIKETEDALAAIRLNTRRLGDQDIAAEASSNAWHSSTEAYASGSIDYLTLLETQRTYFNNLDTLQTVLHDRSKGVVSLFAALGGGTTLAPRDDSGDTAGAARPAGSANVAGASGTWNPLAPPAQIRPAASRLSPTITPPDPQDWLVSVAGLQDEDGVNRVASDLAYRFVAGMQDRHVLARQFGRIDDGHGVSVTWYHVFVGRFASKDEATQFCNTLSAQMQRCQPVPASDPMFRTGLLSNASVKPHVE